MAFSCTPSCGSHRKKFDWRQVQIRKLRHSIFVQRGKRANHPYAPSLPRGFMLFEYGIDERRGIRAQFDAVRAILLRDARKTGTVQPGAI